MPITYKEAKKMEDRFWDNVSKKDCWLWEGYVGNEGYGQVQFRIEKEKFSGRAHRVSCVLYLEVDLAENDIVRHQCNNRHCVNPNHLKIGSHADNVQDRIDMNNSAKGEDNGRSVLSAEEVEKIESKFSDLVYDLSSEFDVSRKIVRQICKGKTWRSVTDIASGHHIS